MTTYTCTICERVFSRRSSLRNHVKIHDNILIDRALRKISEDRQEREENTVFSDDEDDDPELTGDKQQEFEQEENLEEKQEDNLEEEQEDNLEEEEQEENPGKEEQEDPEEEDGSSSHPSLSLDGEGQEEAEEAVVIISYLIYTSLKSIDHLMYNCTYYYVFIYYRMYSSIFILYEIH